MKNGHWRGDNEALPIRSLSKRKQCYVGLKNQHSTCYMNSLFQQLYMVEGFRNQILSVNSI